MQRNVSFIRECTSHRSVWAVVLGSGLGGVADSLSRAARFPYEMLHGMGDVTVQGHAGVLSIGLLGGIPAAVFSGRLHAYEAVAGDSLLFQVRLCAALGIKNIILTNAAGGLDRRMRAGDFMVISDHVDLMRNARAFHDRDRQPGQPELYDGEYKEVFLETCLERGVRCTQGVYAGMAGPEYETPAEVSYLKRIGACAVGMSTVHEAVEAARLGMRVLGVSCIANVPGADDDGADHCAVLDATSSSAFRLAGCIGAFMGKFN
ncbi:MAG TPA: purine-nucleoside phosphorylase [bacterium]|nr:purine-nucleoside phosphorylase [bacterium]